MSDIYYRPNKIAACSGILVFYLLVLLHVNMNLSFMISFIMINIIYIASVAQ